MTKIEMAKQRFKDKRTNPICFQKAVFRSRGALAKHFKVNERSFRVRLQSIEGQGIALTDSWILSCKEPFFKSMATFAINHAKTLLALNKNHGIDISEKAMNERILNSDLHTLKLPMWSWLLNVDYETLKKTSYDVRQNKTATLDDIMLCVQLLKPRNPIILNNQAYPSPLNFMLRSNIKLTASNVSKIFSYMTASLG